MSTSAPVQHNTTRFEVTSGPTAGELVDALKYAFDKGKNFTVKFSRYGFSHGIVSHDIEAQIVGVSYESGTPGMFLITINVKGFKTSNGYYDAQARKGWIDLIPN